MEIIAGPILRHADTREINVWLVLDKKAPSIKLEVAAQNLEPLGVSQEASHTPIKAGKKAFVYLLKAVPNDPEQAVFPTGKVLYYDLEIDGRRLADFGLTGDGEGSITYKGESLPSFVLKDRHDVIIEGSCRKPHAFKLHALKGMSSQPDMMVTADDLLEADRDNLQKRPTLLFLTGDQIYADDVSAPILANIQDQVKKYITVSDSIPLPEQENIKLADLPLNGRDRLLSDEAMRFTSEHKSNHLLSFGEYFMMYCTVWSGLGASCPTFDKVKDRFEYSQVGDHEDQEDERREIKTTYGQWRRVSNEFLRNARRVRRLLANVPTYMIFDDHEVTDDWNLSPANQIAFREHPLSQRVQVNAMAAYWLCQGWGNAPKQFPKGFKDSVQSYLKKDTAASYTACKEVLLNRYWGYELDTRPYVLVLDTRTQREFRDGSKVAALINKDKLAELGQRLQKISKNKKRDNSLLLVSPTPVYGFTAVERLQLAAKEENPEKLDVECWIADEKAYKQLQSVIHESGFDRCAIFSGDVHYGFCRHERLISSAGDEVHVFQLTSSSLHNAPGFEGKIGLDALADSSSFLKTYTSYLFPTNEREKFINQSPNVGILHFENGKPTTFTLSSEKPSTYNGSWLSSSGSGYAWEYDLKKRTRLESPVDDSNGELVEDND